jgi:hypothetical protein
LIPSPYKAIDSISPVPDPQALLTIQGDFAKEKVDIRIERDLDQLPPRSIYGKFVFKKYPPINDSKQFLEWGIQSSNRLARLLYDVTKFLCEDDNNTIDSVYAVEYALSVKHLFHDACLILSSHSSYQNKARAFRIADILSNLAHHGTLAIDEAKFFKDFFRCDTGLQTITDIFKNSGINCLIDLSPVITQIYANLKSTILDSVWVPGKVTGGNVYVRNRVLGSENLETEDEFTGNVIRALRNTHHGYLTRGDPNFRPSRYLSLIDGNTRDDLPTIALAWLLAFLESPETIIGNQADQIIYPSHSIM